MCKSAKYIILILLFFKNFSLFGESTISHNNFVYNIGYGQNLNSYQWINGIKYKRAFGRTGLLDVAENFNSSLIHLGTKHNK